MNDTKSRNTDHKETDSVNPQPELTFRVEGLDCAECALHLEGALTKLPAVSEAQVDFMRGRLRVTAAPDQAIIDEMTAQARQLGYILHLERAGDSSNQPNKIPIWLRHKRELSTALATFFVLLAFVAQWMGAPPSWVHGFFFLAIVAGGYFIARSAWNTLRATHSPDMNALMTLAVTGAMAIGEWTEGAMVVLLFSIGETLESYTMNRARNAIGTLINLMPREATRLTAGGEEVVPVEELAVGDRILVRPGERISMDGEIESGRSAINEAPVTGESIPVEKAVGDRVYAGTINGQGAIVLQVTHRAADNTIARIIKMVEEAEQQRAPSQRFVDRFARYYTPAILGAAAMVAVFPPLSGIGQWSDWIYRALVLLVVGCPCALVISTPVSIVAAISSAARSGVLIKGGAYLEALGTLRVVAFDKTGTLTHGEPQVVDTRCATHPRWATTQECATCNNMLLTAAAIESRSDHPLGRAVVQEALERGYTWSEDEIADVEALSGRGIRGIYNGHPVTIGSHQFVHDSEDGPGHDDSFCQVVRDAEESGDTVMIVDCSSCGLQGYIALADKLRDNAPQAIAALRACGITKTIMLTGDNAATAEAISRKAGIDEFKAGLLPADKVTAVDELLQRYGTVAMVGDGINDAPALARATVGIAMGAAGSAAALETADVALMADNLNALPVAIRLGKRALATIKQNIVFALALKALFLALAVAGLATLWMAVFADVGASLIVILNGMRLLRVHSVQTD